MGDYHTALTAHGETLICRTRGKLRQPLLPGDWVQVKMIGANEGLIVGVAKRERELARPRIANVDQAVIVMAMAQPPPSWHLLDRLLITAEKARLRAVIVLNKADLVEPEALEAVRAQYAGTRYDIVITSVEDGIGIDALGRQLKDRLSVLAGPSGAGKSSLLNALMPKAQLQTGATSERGGQGRHTTRYVSILSLPQGGWVADSPGFAVLDLKGMDPRELPQYYPDYMAHAGSCRFSGCLHRHEPGCHIKILVESGGLSAERYSRYVDILNEIEDAFERRF